MSLDRQLASRTNGSLVDVAKQIKELADYAWDAIQNGYFETAYDDDRAEYGIDDNTPANDWTKQLEGHIVAIEGAFDDLQHSVGPNGADLLGLFASLKAHQSDQS